jgi:hypothetical protein
MSNRTQRTPGRPTARRSALACLAAGLLAATPAAAEILPMSVETQPSMSANCVGDLDFGSIARPSGYADAVTVAVAPTAGARAQPGGNLLVSGGSSVACTVGGAIGATTATLAGGGASGAFDPGSSTLSGVKLTRVGGGELVANVTVSALTGSAFYVGGVLTVPVRNVAPDGTYTSDEITLTVTDDGVPP